MAAATTLLAKSVILATSWAPLLSGLLWQCHNADDPTCRGGVAAFRAILRQQQQQLAAVSGEAADDGQADPIPAVHLQLLDNPTQITMPNYEESKDSSKRSRSRDRGDPNSLCLKLTGLPSGCAEADIKGFLTGASVEAVSISGDSCLVKVAAKSDADACLAHDTKQCKGSAITVRRAPADAPVGGPKVEAALRLQGLPFRATEEEIAEFFEDFNMVSGSVKFQLNEEQRKTGIAAVKFESEEDAERAFKEKQKQEIGGRWILLNDLDVEDWDEFESYDPENKNVRCGDSVNEDNVERCVKLRGLPWAANKGTVVEFFEGFTIKKSDITIDVQCGKNSGFAIVQLMNEDEAARACADLDRKEIGTRWIGVSPAELRRGRRQD